MYLNHIARSLIGCAILLIVACNQPQTSTHSSKATTKIERVPLTAIAGKLDPVCQMDFDSSWVETIDYQGYKVTFCSENCKKAFLGRPQKFIY